MSCPAKHEYPIYAKANSPHIPRTPVILSTCDVSPQKVKNNNKDLEKYWSNLNLIKSTYTTCTFIVMTSILTKSLFKLVRLKLSHGFENEIVIECIFYNELIIALSRRHVTLRR